MITSLSFLMSFIKRKHLFILGYIALLLESLTPIIAIMLQRDIINNVFLDKQYNEFNVLIALYAVFFFAPKLLFTIRRVIFYNISYDLQMALTEDFLSKIYNVPMTIFNKEHTGKLLNHIRTDITEASDLSMNKLLSESVKVLLSIVFLATSIAYISLELLVIVVIVALSYYLLLLKFGDKTKEYSQQVKEEKGMLSVEVEESISAVREIISYNRQKWQVKNFEKKFTNYYNAILKQCFYKVKILMISDPFLYGTKLTVIIFGGLSLMNNNMSLGEFVVSFTLVDKLVTELGLLFEQALTGKRLLASVECIQSVMNHESESFGNSVLKEDVESIVLKNVTFAYSDDSDPVLKNISIDFPVGKKIAFVGESGCGKSTIAQLLIRSIKPTIGEVLINERVVDEYDEKYTEKISIVFQQPYFLSYSIKENLVLDKDYNEKDIVAVCRNMLCHDFINDFTKKYDTQVGERGTTLSGGQKQRIAISRAVLKNTDILILDEATSALDTETEYIIQKNLDELRQGKTTIIIAHIISTIQNSDIIYVMDKGEAVDFGTHEALLMKSPLYNKLYKIQQVS